MLFLFGRIRPESRDRFALAALLFLSVLAVSLLIPGHSAVQNPQSYYLRLSEPANWISWMPTAGSEVVFTATTDASPPSASVTFYLSCVTSREGRYMNDKDEEGNLDSDLYFALPEDQAELYGGKITWSGGGVNATTITAAWETRPVPSPGEITVPVKVVCNDYAAYGTIFATLSLGANSESHTIPMDENNNTLADAWDDNYYWWWLWAGWWRTPISEFTRDHLLQDRDEGGWIAYGVNSGDGFTLFEEYRGFMVGGNHSRLHPEKKDVFLLSKMSNMFIPQAEGSIGYAYNLPMHVHQINENEWDNFSSRVVNFCGGTNPQKAVRILESQEELDNTFGEAWFINRDNPYNPNNTDLCVIFSKEIMGSIPSEHVDHFFRKVIAHEVGHSVGLAHHWLRHNGHGVVTFPTNPTDACVMNTGGRPELSWDDIILWNGTGYAFSHESPPDEPDYEDHWRHYRLHTNHEGHPTYGDE